ncbi:MAG: hypothetical protein AB8F74_07845 [Saprospiraceae bacterium]
MDYFNEQFGDFDSSDHSDLPEGFGWEDMKDDIYEKMDEKKPKPNYKKYWPLFLLLLMVGCGTGSWFALKQVDGNRISENAFNENINNNENLVADNSTELIDKENLNTEKEISTEKTKEEQLAVEKIDTPKNNTKAIQKTKTVLFSNQSVDASQSNNTILKKEVLPVVEEESETITEINIPTNTSVGEEPELNKFVESGLTLIGTNKLQLPSMDFEGLSSQLLPVVTTFSKPSPSKEKFKPQVQISLAAGLSNLSTFGDNLNKDHVSGYPGYSINPSVQLFIRPRHALQVDYEFTAVQELFDYDGSRPISVSKENVVVEELVSSLTGKVINSERKNVIVPGTRSYREVKYNQYQFHTLSLGYHFATAKKKRSSFGFYTGASYLLQMNQEGKRLNEELDVVAFDNNNKVFTNHQFGLRLGVNYDFSLSEKTALFSQLVATQYLTNWEVGTSNATTRPLLYGLQIGIRQRL